MLMVRSKQCNHSWSHRVDRCYDDWLLKHYSTTFNSTLLARLEYKLSCSYWRRCQKCRASGIGDVFNNNNGVFSRYTDETNGKNDTSRSLLKAERLEAETRGQHVIDHSRLAKSATTEIHGRGRTRFLWSRDVNRYTRLRIQWACQATSAHFLELCLISM